VLGLDLRDFVSGAVLMDTRCGDSDARQNPGYLLGALLERMLTVKHRPIQVLMPYAQALHRAADWYRQLWAESLGKAQSLTGETIHVGPTPVLALGTTDQHSQLQLYMEGPHDKVVGLIGVDRFRCESRIPEESGNPDDYLSGADVGDLMQAARVATAEALRGAGRPNYTLHLESVTPRSLGALYYLWEVATVFAARRLNVNPYDQPGVEASKQGMYALLGRSGYEAQRDAISSDLDKGHPYVVD
jgi:glucose-6-phosphate isomerase